MRILFASGNGYLPEFRGGVQSSTDHLVRQCLKKGYTPAVLAALFGDGAFGFYLRLKLKLSSKPATTDHRLGYPVIRSWFPWDVVDYVADTFKPDVAVVQCHKTVKVGKALAAKGIPLVVYLRNVEFHQLEGDPRELSKARFISNSQFTADTYMKKFGIVSTVIPPTIDIFKYSYKSSKEFVTFINLYPEKGYNKALDIARGCPDIKFLFVESWKMDEERLSVVEKEIAELHNVTFMRRTDDMRRVFGRTKVLLAPSKWEEAWGRVASEAHCSGIPVIGSNRGGLPEAIGPGGIVLNYEAPLEDWIDAVRLLCQDNTAYENASNAALHYAHRAELNAEEQFRTFLSILTSVASTPIQAPR